MTTTHSESTTSGRPAPGDCGCQEHQASERGTTRSGLPRRGLLRLTAGAGLLTATTLHDARVAFAATPTPTPTGTGAQPGAAASGGDVLVVVSLRGGFDSLSAIVPVGDSHYAASRPGIAVPAAQTKKVDTMFGLAPGLKALYPLWDAGKVAAVHAVGQQDPTRSHFEAMAEMERAAPGSSLRTGWIDRSIGAMAMAGPFGAAQVGNAQLPASLYGDHAKFAVASLNGIKIGVDESVVPTSAWATALGTLHRGARPEIAEPTANAVAAVTRLKALPKAVDAAAAGYPSGGLGPALHDVARLVKANLGLRFATVDMGNWDMHQNLGTAAGGWMYNQLTELSGALAAFAKELGPDLNRVTVVTLTEFGRRVAQNGSGGLDHGHGVAVLVMGGGVKGGKVHGRWPGLAASALDSGDLAATTDYRSVMAEILTKRCGVSQLGEVFPGFTPTPVGVV